MKATKFKEIILGILTAIGLWVFGHLLSGRLFFVEDIELYPTGPLVFIFPFIFAAACILIAKYAVKNKKFTYFTASIISIFYPFVSLLLAFILQPIAYHTQSLPIISIVTETLVLVFVFSIVPFNSIFGQMYNILDELPQTLMLIIMLASIIPVIVGAVISIRIFIKRKNTSQTDNISQQE